MAKARMSFTEYNHEVRNYIINKYKGKVRHMSLNNDPMLGNTVKVHIEFLIPFDEADELEMYRRIIRVIDVVAEGDKDE
jgi:hypothetical protein